MSTAESSAQSLSSPQDSAIARSALRKVGLRLLPLIGIGYAIAFMDRANVSFAALQMNRDLHFSASAYGLGAGLFFITYVAFEVPSNLLLIRFGARRWLARIMFTWGLLSIVTMFVHTPGEFYLARLALGAAEAGFFPGLIFYLALWFPVAQRSQAIARFYIALPLSSVIMGALAGALLNLNGYLNLAGWQWLFFFEGLPAIVISIVFLLLLPDGPQKAAWLTEQERGWILQQLANEAASCSDAHSAGSIRRAFGEPRVWLLGVIFFCLDLGLYGYTFTAPAIIQHSTGFTAAKVGFTVALIGVLGALAMLFNGWHSDRSHERYIHAFVPALIMAASFLAAGLSLRPVIAIPALALIYMTACGFQPPLWSLPTTFLSGTSAAVAVAIVNTIANLGGFVAPLWLGIAHDLTGTYQRGLLTLVIPALVAGAVILIARGCSNSRRPQRSETRSN